MSSYLYDKLNQARGLLDRRAKPKATEVDSIKQDSFDKTVYRELLDEAPALAELTYEDLGQKYDYTEELVGDILQEFWQGDPLLRPPTEMHPSFLLNHAVARDILAAPETPQTRAFTKHDRYGSAMATIAVTEKIKKALEDAKDAQEAAKQAAEAEQQLRERLEDLEGAIGCFPMGGGGDQPVPGTGSDEDDDEADDEQPQGCQPGGAGGQADDEDEDSPSGPLAGGEGPLTEQQAQDIEALIAALQAATEAELDYEQKLSAAQEEAQQLERKMRQPVREGVMEAGDMLADEQDLFTSWGVEDGYLERLSFQERQQLARALRANRLNEFRRLIGRFRTMGEAQRAKKVEFARDETYSVEMSDRLPDVLASEYALLANQHTRLDFLQRLTEGQLLSKKYRGIEKVGQGSIIALIDNSGSMAQQRDRTGLSREAYAKAFALALLDQARAADRDFVGINFSSRHQVSVFRFPKGKGDITEVLRFVEEFYNGGTDFMAPLDQAMDILEAEFNDQGLMRADLVMVTDDDCRVTDDWLAAYQARKEKLGFRTFGVAVGTHAGNALASLSDNVRSVMEFADPMSVADIIRTV